MVILSRDTRSITIDRSIHPFVLRDYMERHFLLFFQTESFTVGCCGWLMN